MSTVDQMLAQFKSSGGVARGNRYRVTFDGDDGNKLNILCDSVTMPGRQISTTEYMTNMKAYKRPYNFINEDVSVSFILTNDWYTWNYLKDWQSSIINDIDTESGAYTVNLKSQYAKQVIIDHLNEQNQITKSIKLFNAFPITLNSTELANSNESSVLRCSTVLAYDNWSENFTGTVTTQPLTPVTGFGISTIV